MDSRSNADADRLFSAFGETDMPHRRGAIDTYDSATRRSPAYVMVRRSSTWEMA
ncbi:hypothetical protein AB0P36_18130 [Streptomyces flavidovirens]|uniref:hypothetical protein n=1 Tax=Streptomyces flavidovirens TaxID=67298 RepID=UPI00343041C2